MLQFSNAAKVKQKETVKIQLCWPQLGKNLICENLHHIQCHETNKQQPHIIIQKLLNRVGMA